MSAGTTGQEGRFDPLDALRGLSILLMIFSGKIPYGILPDWMYHAQVPPPLHTFNPSIPGITWVDLVFPFFLFAMGAAIPLALQRRVEAGLRPFLTSVLQRGLTLAFFAIYVQHIKPWGMATDAAGSPLWSSWAISLAGFLCLFPALVRLPKAWSLRLRAGTRALGWGGMIVFLASVRYADGTGFLLERSDIIILVLANVYVTGSLIWVFTRGRVLPRLAALAILAGIILSARADGWIGAIWNADPAPWLFQWMFQKYLFLVLPGTIIGEMVMQSMKRPVPPPEAGRLSLDHAAWILPVILTVLVVIGLKQRVLLTTTLVALLVMGGLWWVLRHREQNGLPREFLGWATTLLLIGLALEPFEGGIRKDHSTFSYYFVTGGLAIFVLMAFCVLMERLKIRRPFRFLVETGQNPLVAYAGVHSLIPPLLGLVGVYDLLERLTPGAWPGVFRGGVLTYLTALAGSFCTRNGIRLRA